MAKPSSRTSSRTSPRPSSRTSPRPSSRTSPRSIHDFLETTYLKFNQSGFIENDPISIPHRFSSRADIEIAGFLTSVISWGTRPGIIRNASRLMEMMDCAPFQFISSFKDKDLKAFRGFAHRTFQGDDCIFFLKSLQKIYHQYGDLESCFRAVPPGSASPHPDQNEPVKSGILAFRNRFFSLPHPKRTEKHLGNPSKGSSCKRINMFLRWMVRKDENGVDFGLWKVFSPFELICPLDVHSAGTARKLGLLTRKINDWKAAVELTDNLRILDPEDPVKYDFSLFGAGVYGILPKNK